VASHCETRRHALLGQQSPQACLETLREMGRATILRQKSPRLCQSFQRKRHASGRSSGRGSWHFSQAKVDVIRFTKQDRLVETAIKRCHRHPPEADAHATGRQRSNCGLPGEQVHEVAFGGSCGM